MTRDKDEGASFCFGICSFASFERTVTDLVPFPLFPIKMQKAQDSAKNEASDEVIFLLLFIAFFF